MSLRVLSVEGSGGESFEVQARGELQLGLLIGGCRAGERGGTEGGFSCLGWGWRGGVGAFAAPRCPVPIGPRLQVGPEYLVTLEHVVTLNICYVLRRC